MKAESINHGFVMEVNPCRAALDGGLSRESTQFRVDLKHINGFSVNLINKNKSIKTSFYISYVPLQHYIKQAS